MTYDNYGCFGRSTGFASWVRSILCTPGIPLVLYDMCGLYIIQLMLY